MVVKKGYSAPGKALLVGGYLVLDPKYTSYVVALSARMHGLITTTEKKNQDSISITVRSPQFNDDKWQYIASGGEKYVIRERNGLKNPFIEAVLVNILAYFQPVVAHTKDIDIEIFSDPEYHSSTNCQARTNNYKTFNYHSSTITKVPKTGLGSSAGLVTVLTTVLCSLFIESLDIHDPGQLKIIHNLAQISHCQAQGKVGSGFDVAAAVYGSIQYQRFAPELLVNLSEPTADDYHSTLCDLVNNTDWKTKNNRIRLAKGFRLVMGDVNNGSETTKLVAKVNEWYKTNLPRSQDIYEDINKNNMIFIKALSDLNEMAQQKPEYYSKLLASLKTPSDIKNFPELVTVKKAISQVRAQFRLITKESGADIEPPVQTELLDRCMTVSGVLTGMVPGAGGYDAIALITSADVNIQNFTSKYQGFDNVQWLDLQQADLGIIEEDPNHYSNLC